jgi:hypothetical protein
MLKKWVGLGFLLLVAALSLGLVVLGCSSGGTKTGSPATAGGTVATTSNLQVTTTGSVASAPIPSTDTTDPDASSSTTEPDTVSPGPASSAAETLANGLGMLQGGLSWSYEPRGDVTGDIASAAPGQMVFAVISDVAPDGSHLTFDAVQRYVGLPLAADEAAKDRVKDFEDVVYLRNEFKHPQTVPLAPDAGIILDASADGADYRSSLVDLGVDLGFFSATPAQFGHMFNNDPTGSATEVWLLIEEGSVKQIFSPYHS